MKNEEMIQSVKGYLSERGYKLIDTEYYEHIYNWIDWYKGYKEKFHKYRMFNGFGFIDKKRTSLKMAKRVAEEWSSLLYNDRVCITVGRDSDSEEKTPEQSVVDDALERNCFSYKFSELIERTFALGTGAMVVYKDELGKAKIDYIIAPMIFPLRVDNGEIVDCAFASVKGDRYYINIHRREPSGSYTVENRMFRKTADGYADLEFDDMVQNYTTPAKMFQVIRPNIANNLDLFTPFGISVFANALDQNSTIDIIYDSLRNEFELGRKRLFVRTDTLTYKTVIGISAEGSQTEAEVPIFDREQTEFFALPGEENDNAITEVNPALRTNEHIEALQTALNLFSDTCGLGPDRFVFRDGNVYTNTSQVISTQSKLYKNLVNHEKVLRPALKDMIKALIYAETGKLFEDDITIDFDDSIVEDMEKTRTQAILELNNGLIDEIQYYQDVYKMTEKQAAAFREKIKKRTPEEEPEEEPPYEE